MLRLAAGLMLAWTFCAGAADAQTLTLSCRFGNIEIFNLREGQVAHAPETPFSAESFLTLNFETKTFVFSSTNGSFATTDAKIIMMAQVDDLRGLWEIDRQTGRLTVIATSTANDSLEFQRLGGQCEPESGTPF